MRWKQQACKCSACYRAVTQPYHWLTDRGSIPEVFACDTEIYFWLTSVIPCLSEVFRMPVFRIWYCLEQGEYICGLFITHRLEAEFSAFKLDSWYSVSFLPLVLCYSVLLLHTRKGKAKAVNWKGYSVQVENPRPNLSKNAKIPQLNCMSPFSLKTFTTVPLSFF